MNNTLFLQEKKEKKEKKEQTHRDEGNTKSQLRQVDQSSQQPPLLLLWRLPIRISLTLQLIVTVRKS